MSQNPFESPQANPYIQQQAPARSGGGTIDIGAAISEGWAATTANAGIAIGGTIVGMLLMILGYITILGILLVLPVVGYGFVRLYLNITDNRAEIGDLFEGFRNYGTALGSMLLFVLITIGVSLPAYALQIGGAVMEVPAVAIVGQLVGFVIALFVTVRLYFAPFFIVDQQMGGVDAVKDAWESTKELKGTVIGLAIVAGLIGMSGIIALGVGVLFTMPLSYTIWACAYRQLAGR